MQEQSTSKQSKMPSRRALHMMLCFLLFPTLITLIIYNSHITYSGFFFSSTANNSHVQIVLPHSIHNQISHLQSQLGALLDHLHIESSESKSLTKFSDQVLSIAISLDKLADCLSGFLSNAPDGGNEMSRVDEDLSEPEQSEAEEGSLHGKAFNSAELINYISPKSNRFHGKKNFLGLEAVNPSIGLGCAPMAFIVDRFMTYKIDGMCPNDWDLAQKLILGGCDPLPRRRCFSMAPPHYTTPANLNSSLWTQPSDANILWNNYKCKNYNCLENPRNESASAEFTIDEVLRLRPGEIRIGLDFTPTTGTFAAIMREKNITIASATLNLGAPFSEVIALRGLLPLYISVGSRLPFFDNALDIVHSTLFLDGWISLELLQFVLFDWDRVLWPKGLLWVDRFCCKKEDMRLYLDEFTRLGYRELLWRVVPKTDKLDDELFFSAVLEKPIRG
ncbi:unnamed protein product [Ilex paraguariensis]|uniref:S-adenosyl-L-methionine-dependent methyltransferase n=1 Tax=Ilex paraguariensis TaxID=185542 RepID=A0ABC8SU04_9AQUA